jgi:hypothetical protein
VNWHDIGVGLFLLGIIASGCGLAFIATSELTFKQLMRLLSVLIVMMGSGMGLMIANEVPKTVEDLDETKCAQYVYVGHWECVPWEQAG